MGPAGISHELVLVTENSLSATFLDTPSRVTPIFLAVIWLSKIEAHSTVFSWCELISVLSIPNSQQSLLQPLIQPYLPLS